MGARRPNVLLIVADQMKASASPLYGGPAGTTPALERLAAHGTTFDRAITPSPLCVPARVALLSGRWPHATGARRNETPMPAGTRHAFRVWKEAGFHTALIGKDHCFAEPDDLVLFDVRCPLDHDGPPEHDPPVGMAWPKSDAEIAAAHAPRRAMPRQAPAISYRVSDVDPEATGTGLVAAQTERWLEERAADARPFAAWVSFPDPHTPYEVPRPWAETVPPESIELPPIEAPDDPALPERNRVLRRILDVGSAGEEERRRLAAVYQAMVRFVDHGVGRILDALDRTGLRKDTIVVFTSDHGDFAGEHGMTRKGGVFYDCLIRVPLIVSWPGRVPEGAREPSPVNLVDLTPTLLRLQGLPVPAGMQGQPLPTVTDAPPREATVSEYGAGGPPCTLADMDRLPAAHGLEASKATLRWREAEGRRKAVRTRRYTYVTDPMGDLDELYDHETDPHELRNLAHDPAHADVVRTMREHLLAWSLRSEDAVPVPLPEAAPDLGAFGSEGGSSA